MLGLDVARAAFFYGWSLPMTQPCIPVSQASTSFARPADPEPSCHSCLVVPSIKALICCRSHQAFTTADVMRFTFTSIPAF
ncbi:hypothetical protein BU25DRAFT_413789 [Macroventuria anomochaeta]|uniref:Uncharacterized protein n=1 Tax=Macroventuria anomochaeta TaxID=301207 RepID=A0ACB6RTT8_9PLEO|nr:uncharacterized protein BU25DRAFT_413789 [Macroventuria anomochaeta]KAF2624232.1 hypothetical protein BU25DRAFT_413789 [Macroventuria anomochaeta]